MNLRKTGNQNDSLVSGRTRQGSGKGKTSTAGKMVTQSTRFTPAQMAEIEKACKLKGWSISQLMQVATLEKAVAVNQVTERRPDIMRIATQVAEAMRGAPPRILYSDELIHPLEDAQSWYQGQFDDAHVRGRELREHPYTAQWDMSSGEVTIQAEHDEGVDEIVKVRPFSVSPAVVDQYFRCLAAIGHEMAPLLKEADSEVMRNRLPEDQRLDTLRTAADLLEKGGGSDAKE